MQPNTKDILMCSFVYSTEMRWSRICQRLLDPATRFLPVKSQDFPATAASLGVRLGVPVKQIDHLDCNGDEVESHSFLVRPLSLMPRPPLGG